MEIYWKGIVVCVIAVVLLLTLEHQSKNISILLAMAVACIICTLSFSFLSPVLSFMKKLRDVTTLDHALISTLIKAVGISIVTELAALISEDAGNKTLGKSVQFLGTGALLWLCIPLMEQVLSLIEGILKQL